MFRAQAEAALQPVRRDYDTASAGNHLQVAVAPSEHEIAAELTGWIGAATTTQ
jgi:hypothetical protein